MALETTPSTTSNNPVATFASKAPMAVNLAILAVSITGTVGGIVYLKNSGKLPFFKGKRGKKR